MAISNSYVKLPEGNFQFVDVTSLKPCHPIQILMILKPIIHHMGVKDYVSTKNNHE